MKPTNTKQRNVAFWSYLSLLIVTFLIFGFSVYIYAYTPVVENKDLKLKLENQGSFFGDMDQLQQKIDTINSNFNRLDVIDKAYKEALGINDVEEMAFKQGEFKELYRRLNKEITRDFEAQEGDAFGDGNNIRSRTGALYNRLLSRYNIIMALRDREASLIKNSEDWRVKHDELSVMSKEEEMKKEKLDESCEESIKEAEKTIKKLENQLDECKEEYRRLRSLSKKKHLQN